MREKLFKAIKINPESIPKYIYSNAKNRFLNPKINEAIWKHKEKYKKIEMHESHNSKPFIRNNLRNDYLN